jgi:hypothetical protein
MQFISTPDFALPVAYLFTRHLAANEWRTSSVTACSNSTDFYRKWAISSFYSSAQAAILPTKPADVGIPRDEFQSHRTLRF